MNEHGYVTRAELTEVERALRQGLLETERLLRAEFTSAIHDFRVEVKGDLGDLDAHLTRQDAMLLSQASSRRDWKRSSQIAFWSTVGGGLVSFVVWSALHALHLA